ncbi:hypothetical protein GCM10009678_29780 [Actinomadura kijaniata]|uniref:Ferritin-like domain-containing protein n=1 Tax=Actinomadura namibiensis TaxID=182080 RepID=A0A7W3LK22_ACTNM|nr:MULTISPECIES: hypothetical protein [Actinomadura]MBA8949580.1 hypothetical protein [Actinomadura namibiensis]
MPEAVTPGAPGVSRRAVLGTGAFALPLLSGCEPPGAVRRTAHADVPALVAAITDEQDLIAFYEAARSAHAGLARRLDAALAHHREHLAVLRRHLVPGSGPRRDEGGAVPAPRVPQVPRGTAQTLAALREAEARAAAARLAAVAKAAPGLAQLMASIGACEAGHAVALGGRP